MYRNNGNDVWLRLNDNVVASTMTVPNLTVARVDDEICVPMAKLPRCQWCHTRAKIKNGCCTRCGGPE